MNNARILVVAIILAFAWRGEIKTAIWPPANKPDAVAIEKPDAEALGWVAGVNVAGMTPKDRLHAAGFYQALRFVLKNDRARPNKVMDTTEKFSLFQAGSLQLAIDQGDVGRYPGLGASIDRAFFAAAGDDDDKTMTDEVADKLMRCCGALAWRLSIHADE